MGAQLASSFDPRPDDTRRLSRAINVSIAVHVLVVIGLLVVPRSWWTREPARRDVMTINLGGSPGARTTGRTSIGSRTVEQVAPPPKRPEPARPTPERPPAAAAVPKPAAPKPPAPAPVPVVEPPKPVESARPPVTGAELNTGNTLVETGARGQGAGLSAGRFGGGGETDLSDFCCPEYLEHLLSTIDARWQKDFAERGTTTLKFTVNRDGSIDNILVDVASGYGVLDRAARSAVMAARLRPLPAAYPNPTLTVNLKFPYGTP